MALVGGAGPIGLLLSAILKAKGLTVVITELSAKRKQRRVNRAWPITSWTPPRWTWWPR